MTELVLDRSYQHPDWGLVDVYRHPVKGYEREQVVSEDEWLDVLEDDEE